MLSYGATWLQDSELPWATTATLRYEFPGKQKDTDIEPGDVVIVELAAGKEVAKGFDLGITGYYLDQISEEKNSPLAPIPPAIESPASVPRSTGGRPSCPVFRWR
jgi:hypothetical protein